jgi:methionyl-tRNA synthetase
MALAQAVNRYIDSKAPWKAIRTDRQDAATSLWVCANALSCLATVTYPYLPFSAQKLHAMLGFSGAAEARGWTVPPVRGGQPIPRPEPLFTKLEEPASESDIPHPVTKAR